MRLRRDGGKLPRGGLVREEALVNLKQKLDQTDNKDKRARIGFLLINLRGVVHSQRSEFSDLSCGR